MKISIFVRTLVIAAAMAAVVSACSNTEDPAQSTPNTTEQQIGSSGETDGTTVPVEQPAEQPRVDLEKIATEDAEKYMDALKKEDAEALSSLMAHAENENVPATMKIVIEGFRLHFDKLADLKLTLESNQQSEEYYIENFLITGKKEGEERSLPFQVKYAKQDDIAALLNADKREPLYDSPYIGQYPYAVRDVERYVQALAQKDVESAALHLGVFESTEEAKSAVQHLLQAYTEKLDLATVKAVSLGYDANKKQFLFDLRDGKKQSHSIQVDADRAIIIDDWAATNK